MKFLEIKPATDKGNSEPNILINLANISCIRPAKINEKGSCTFLLHGDSPEIVAIETWEDYAGIMIRLELV